MLSLTNSVRPSTESDIHSTRVIASRGYHRVLVRSSRVLSLLRNQFPDQLGGATWLYCVLS